MLKTLKRVVYTVSDVSAAKSWYAGVLGYAPIFESPLVAIFAVGDCTLSLAQGSPGERTSDEATIYWQVDDIEDTYRKLLAAGAGPADGSLGPANARRHHGGTRNFRLASKHTNSRNCEPTVHVRGSCRNWKEFHLAHCFISTDRTFTDRPLGRLQFNWQQPDRTKRIGRPGRKGRARRASIPGHGRYRRDWRDRRHDSRDRWNRQRRLAGPRGLNGAVRDRGLQQG